MLPLLLAAALVAPILGRDVFDFDEAATMNGAGARHIGPYSPAEAVAVFVSRWPNHAWGQVMVYSLWGRVAGWSELAIRTVPWLTGLLTLACVYRFGRALFTARIALAAMLLMATSVLFLTYMHVARSYAAAMLFAAIVIWAYWRVALSPRPPGHGSRARPGAGRDRAVVLPFPWRAAAARAGALPPVLRAQGAPLVAAGGIARVGRAACPATSP